MIAILVDHNMEGYATLLWGTLVSEGWLDLVPIRILDFAAIDLPFNSNDRIVWRTAQEQRLLLLTDNRNMEGDDSLEQTLREENTSGSLPVLTILRLRVVTVWWIRPIAFDALSGWLKSLSTLRTT